MAQLRDVQTSNLLAEGTPLQVVLAARALGVSEVIYDDVGAGFDPDAVVSAHEEQLGGTAKQKKDAKSVEKAIPVGDLEVVLAQARDESAVTPEPVLLNVEE